LQAIRDLLKRSNGEAEIVTPEIVEPVVSGSLMACKGTTRVTRADLALIPIPESTDTFKPVHHATLIDELEKALAFRHISITAEDYAISTDGMKLFSFLTLNADHEGVTFALGLRNANNRSMRLGMVAGYSVRVCSNMSFSGDFRPLLAKHSRNFDLIESLSLGVDRIQRSWDPLRRTIDAKRNLQLEDGQAKQIIYDAFTVNRLPSKLLKTVHHEMFVNPSYDEFKPRTLWSLENAMTTAFKQLKPVPQYEATSKLGKFLKPFTSNN